MEVKPLSELSFGCCLQHFTGVWEQTLPDAKGLVPGFIPCGCEPIWGHLALMMSPRSVSQAAKPAVTTVKKIVMLCQVFVRTGVAIK